VLHGITAAAAHAYHLNDGILCNAINQFKHLIPLPVRYQLLRPDT
jgi:hypothetical protein